MIMDVYNDITVALIIWIYIELLELESEFNGYNLNIETHTNSIVLKINIVLV